MHLLRQRWVRRAIYRTAAVYVGLGVACLIGEIGLRLTGYDRVYVNPLHSFHERDERLGHRGKPNFSARFAKPEFDVVIAHDHEGFRRHEHRPAADSSAPTVWVLGDSFTWGWGVAQGEVYTDQLGRRLEEYRVRNLGLNASGTVQQFRLFQIHAETHVRAGDTVLLAFYANDFHDNVAGNLYAKVDHGQVAICEPEPLHGRLKDSLKDYSCLFNLLAYTIDVHQLNDKFTAVDKTRDEIERERAAQHQITEHFLAEFQRACQARGARFVVAYIPGQAELGEADDGTPERLAHERAWREMFFDCAAQARVETLDLLPRMLAAKLAVEENQRLTFESDEHWTPAGHAVAAKTLADALTHRSAQTASR